MITECPACKKTISTNKIGLQACPKCRASIMVGDPLKDEENKVIAKAMPVQKKQGIEAIVEQQQKRTAKKQKKSAIPWDMLKRIGFVEATVATTKLIFLEPTKLFRTLYYQSRDNRFIPLYGVMLAIIGSLFKFFWILKYFQTYFPSFSVFKGELQNYPQLYTGVMQATGEGKGLEDIYNLLHAPAPIDLAFAIILAPIAAIVINALALFLASTLLGSRTKLAYFYRVVGFSQATALLYIIPFFGIFLVFFWQIVLFFKSFKVMKGFTTKKTILAIIIYIVISSFFSLLSFGG